MEIKIPDLGDDGAEITEILVNTGEIIAKDDCIVVVATENGLREIPSPVDGQVNSIFISVGDTVSEGVVLVDIEEAITASNTDNQEVDEQIIEETQSKVISQAQSDIVEQPHVSEINHIETESIAHKITNVKIKNAKVSKILVNEGDDISIDDPILVVKAGMKSVQIVAPTDGMVEQVMLKVGDKVKNGVEFIVVAQEIIEKSNDDLQPAIDDTQLDETKEQPLVDSHEQQHHEEAVDTDHDDNQSYVEQSPAKELETQTVQRSNKHNAQPTKDVAIHKNAQGTTTRTLPPLPDMSKLNIWGEIESTPVTLLQKISIPQVLENHLIPQVTQFDLADVTDTEDFRSTIKADYEEEGISLTILAFVVKAVAYALIKHPKFNSHLSDDNTQLIIRKSAHMGISISTQDGVVTPVIRDAQNKGIKQIAIEIGELAEKARKKKLTPKDVAGASFSISSQGNLAGTAFTPLINSPQMAILGISKYNVQPRWNSEEEKFEPRTMLPLSLSYDNRVINGSDAAIFTHYIAELLADPRKVLM